MILCKFSDLENYGLLLPDLDDMMEGLGKLHMEKDLAGSLTENRVTLSVQKGKTKEYCAQEYEAHRKYIDVHYMFDGEETIYYQPLDDLRPVQPYDEEKDIGWYEGDGEKNISIRVAKGMCCVLFPEDGHMPCRYMGRSGNHFSKVVIKLPYPQE